MNIIPRLVFGLILMLFISASRSAAQSSVPVEEGNSVVQLVQPLGPGQTPPPVTITLQDALSRAQKNDAQFLSAVSDWKIAREDRSQARDAMLPSLSDSTQFLGTQGNGKNGNGRFITQDGVHVYRQWAVAHEDLSPNTYLLTGYDKAAAAEAIAKAKQEIALRGLNVTVTKDYYALIVAQRKYAASQQALAQAQHFFSVARDLEQSGQAAHADTVRAEIQYEQQKQVLADAQLNMENARLDLAVLLFPTLNEDFTIVDDLDEPQALPPFSEVQTRAQQRNPDLLVAEEGVHEASLEVTAAKGAFLPSISLDMDYGIEANSFALRSVFKEDPELGPLPNLGYFVQASLTFPVWDWGTLRSKVHQAEYKQEQARVELTQAQRQILSNLYSSYNEASVARAAVTTLRRAADLAAESLRLANLRYQAGETTALEVVDAQTTFSSAQNALDDGQARYRLALANLETLTGSF